MLVVMLGSVLIGFALAFAAARRLPQRFPSRPLVLSTGPGGALLGALLTRAVLGSGYPTAPLIGAVGFALAMLSLLIRPAGELRRSATA
jgi:hypothetical protein